MKREPTEYEAARTALSRHFWHHHNRVKPKGRLTERLEFHDELHWELRGDEPHRHAELPDGESQYDTAHRYFAEGESSGEMSG